MTAPTNHRQAERKPPIPGGERVKKNGRSHRLPEQLAGTEEPVWMTYNEDKKVVGAIHGATAELALARARVFYGEPVCRAERIR